VAYSDSTILALPKIAPEAESFERVKTKTVSDVLVVVDYFRVSQDAGEVECYGNGAPLPSPGPQVYDNRGHSALALFYATAWYLGTGSPSVIVVCVPAQSIVGLSRM
jgi:hypothetical protein